ncbi:hypothetical protein FKM82_007107 [Ascaphus truei]
MQNNSAMKWLEHFHHTHALNITLLTAIICQVYTMPNLQGCDHLSANRLHLPASPLRGLVEKLGVKCLHTTILDLLPLVPSVQR